MATGVTVIESTSGSPGDVLRQYQTRLYYSDEQSLPPPSMGGREAMRLETVLPSVNFTHNDLRIYQDQFLRFTWCSAQECGWQDLFPDQLPRMWCPSSGVGGITPASQEVNGVPAAQLIEFQTTTNRGTVQTWCRTSNNQVIGVFEPQADVDVLYLFADGSVNTDPSAFNDSLVFDVPSFCPVVDPSCFRLDLMFVLDHSGSIGESWSLITQFTANLIEQLAVSDQDFKVGINRYAGGTCAVPNVGNYTVFMSHLTTNKDDLLAVMRSPEVSQLGPPCTQGCPLGGCATATVKGITLAMNELNGPNGRVATNKAIVVITDGNGNQPCVGLSGGRSVTALDFPADEWIYDVSDGSCCSNCEDEHDDWLCVAYRQKWNDTQPTIYAVGVPDDPNVVATCGGGGPSCGTLNRIALNDGSDCPGWWPDAQDCCSVGSLVSVETRDRAILVGSYDSLGQVTFSLAEALTCPNPGATPCPNDCRPGGFCCGGVCICVEDCSISHPGDGCQTGICATTASGTQCVAIGSPCSDSDDPTGIIVGSVLGALAACVCLMGLLVMAAIIVALLYRKSTQDIKAWDEKFAKEQASQASPLYIEKNASMTSPLYDGEGGGGD